MRVVAGSLGGRRLKVPPGHATRPTSELVRGAMFNSLTSLGVIQGAAVADLFAGSGALGIEALSRGAASAVFVERDRRAITTIRTNLAELGLGGQATVVSADAVTWVDGAASVDVAFIDPPYAFDRWDHLLARLASGVIVAESGQPLPAVEGWDVLRARRHGDTVVTLLQRRGAPRA